ncbi:demethoxyubiquinone hydroxylase family protein [Govanella unica]|uniref:3-demethoxyubiquinol 3-hydroxylase n=1 Tax=Govanella unica TaxID=2975056 RepID=A0A9X3Z601_9PROT|nr:demethoxyubiquinone hydroxylase family protein [Govania unica]MDA5192631.1 demethoxyubiquinone hydroxylase family protein [Govania unica]
MTRNPEAPSVLPGDPSAKDQRARLLRVDHAGEYGAARIYRGQLDVLGASHPLSATIQHMEAQEGRHLATFDNLLREQQVRPTALGPFWHVAGYALGAATALMGPKAAMACTAAVEEVIDDHYSAQIKALGPEDQELTRTLEDFRAEENEHRQTALDHGAADTPGYRLLSGAIKTGCRAAIWLSQRV